MNIKKQLISGDHPLPSRAQVWRMFDRIALRYDLLNRLLSLGQDVVWRKKLARHLNQESNQRLLDLATGTADVPLFLFQKSNRIRSSIGMDMARQMLEIGRQKIEDRGLDRRITLISADAMRLPFKDESFDAVTIAFGIRNVLDTGQTLREMHRVLRSGGRALILEFSLPSNPFLRRLYLFYFRYLMPWIGGIVSGNRRAYRYLNQTVETFPYGKEFAGFLTETGFKAVRFFPLSFGVATIYRGEKGRTRS